VGDVRFNASHFYEPSNTLMVNFSCRALEASAQPNPGEVDAAHWIEADKIVGAMLPGSLAQWFVRHHLERQL